VLVELEDRQAGASGQVESQKILCGQDLLDGPSKQLRGVLGVRAGPSRSDQPSSL
jgi:hypothetical protein